MARFIALYLPQYYPTKENDEWWGNGFTEWVNVARARSLFKGHVQPHLPADLGFYDLRLSETREAQAALAAKYGIEGFCYWHYWFGNGKRLLERPFTEVLESGNPKFPFCLGWANHSWYKKLWDPKGGKDTLLIEQTYPGIDDYINHFNTLLPAFKDPRYIKVNGKLFFIIFDVKNFADAKNFIKTWRHLAKENGLNDFYFVATDYGLRFYDLAMEMGFDAVYEADKTNIHHNLSKIQKVIHLIKRRFFNIPTVFLYKDAIKYMVMDYCKKNNVIPCITPNWDHSPRSGRHAFILYKSTPELFKKIVKRAFEVIKNKPKQEQIVIIQSWNEWGEGNYLEPDREFGHGYLKALKEIIDENSRNSIGEKDKGETGQIRTRSV